MNEFSALLLGHLIGDYVFQTAWMSKNKTNNSFICFIQCVVYSVFVTLSYAMFVKESRVMVCSVFVISLLSHYHIDRNSFAVWWMKNVTHNYDLKNPFTPLIYAVIDNTIHITLMIFMILTLQKYLV
jgi:hypothetical protein